MGMRWLLGAVGLAAIAAPAWAQQDVMSEDMVVIGSRAAPRVATESAAPVDVLSGAELASRGYDSLTKVLEFLSPSFDYPRSASGPSIAGARPATLRSLGPDQTLVLINGRRRHSSSLIQFNNGAFRGAVPIDFNMIPVSAIERVEILRDGAGAQYGSDAIAGVINVVLKRDAEGGLASAQYGETERGQGRTAIFAGRRGFSLGDDGFLTMSGEIRDRGDTNAAEIDPRVNRVTSTLGDPQSTDIDVVLNAERPLADGLTLYGFVTASHRDAESSPLFRDPTVSPSFYPRGFLPIVNLALADVGANAGVRGEFAGWQWDLSETFGYSNADYSASNTVNTSLGLASPTAFHGGGARYKQNLVDFTIDRDFDLLAGAHLALGLEHRYEAYELVSGDAASYTLSGAQGFPGFHPPSPVDVDRSAVSAFVDGELRLTERLNLGLAVRHEDYTDFGEETTGKASLFWRPIDLIALRGTASTGIRAPSLQQQYFSTVTSQLNAGVLQNVGTFAVDDPVAVALGATPLRPETATSYSLGVVLTPARGLTFSIDAYSIDIDDRIALSENLQGASVASILASHGVTNAAVARFFTNAADTHSEGFEAILNWDTRLGDDGRFSLTLGYGAFDTDVEHLRSNPVLPNIALLGATSIGVMADGQPRTKATLNLQVDWRNWTFTADVVKFGQYYYPLVPPTAFVQGTTSLDLGAAYRINSNLSLMFGVLNATNEYPMRLRGEGTGRPYSEGDPLGFNGREYFARLSASF